MAKDFEDVSFDWPASWLFFHLGKMLLTVSSYFQVTIL